MIKGKVVRSTIIEQGVAGVQLNLTMTHIVSLQFLKSKAIAQQEDKKVFVNEDRKLFAKSTLEVLNFIIGDIPDPFDKSLWVEKESKDIERGDNFLREGPAQKALKDDEWE